MILHCCENAIVKEKHRILNCGEDKNICMFSRRDVNLQIIKIEYSVGS